MTQAVEEWYKQEWYKQMPIITRSYLTAAIVITVGCSLDKKRVNGENFGLSPPINGCDFVGLNLRNKRIVDGENQDLSMGALGYGGGNVDQVKKEP